MNPRNNLAIDALSQVLCVSSLQSEDQKDCPYCIKGRCDKKMWSTFKKEAIAVLTFIEKQNIMNKNVRLPGLGG